MANNYITEVLKKFRALPPEIKEVVGGFEALRVIEGLEQTHRIKLGLLVILVTVGELKMEEIEDYLVEKYSLAPGEAQEINEILQREIFESAINEALMVMPSANAPAARNLSLAEQKRAIAELFRSRLKETLLSESEFIEELNETIFEILGREMGDEKKMFEEDLEKLLYLNQERLTRENIVVDGRSLEPTTANWLRDFISRNTTGFFSNLVLSQYLTDSENARALGQEERQLIAKLLVLYRNLKFFPDTLVDVPRDNWQIIPIDRQNSAASSGRTRVGSESSEEAEGWKDLTAIERKALLEGDNWKK